MTNRRRLGQTRFWFNSILYAPPGTGKTTLAAQAMDVPEMSQVAFLEVEGGMLSVSHREDIIVESLGKDEAGRYTGTIVTDFEAAVWDLIHRRNGFEDVQTVVVDSGTEMQNISMQETVNEAMAREGKDPKKPGHMDEDDWWIDDYGRNTRRMRRLFRMLRDAPIHVIVTALVREEFPKGAKKGPDTKPTAIVPDFNQKLGQSLCGFADFVWYLYVDREDGQRKLLTRPHGPVYAKTRATPQMDVSLPKVIENPQLPEIFTLLTGGGGK